MTATGAQAPRSSRQRYQIVKKIDAGGMAEIFLGKAESLEGMKKTVAIKRVLPALAKNEQFIEMFLDEARLSMLLTHANIVQVFDVGRSGGTFFIVMEFIEGYNLRRVFQRASEIGYRVPLELACHVMMEVCKGLQHAHEKRSEQGDHLRIVHRDLSPPNILVSKSGEVKITDFGLAKAITHLNVTDPGIVKGKFSYLSPEAADGKPIDHRTDIFAAGIVLWELLANRRLFLGKDDLETVEMVRQAEVPSLANLNPQVTHEFERVLERALAQDPKKRYTSAAQFGDSLAQFLFSNSLKVTSYDVQTMMRRLFDESGENIESPEERIGTLIQEEILNLSMLGYSRTGQAQVDGSQPVDADSLSISGTPRFDLREFWANSGMPQPVSADPGQRTQTVMAMEAVASPSDLADMLEGKLDADAGDAAGATSRPAAPPKAGKAKPSSAPRPAPSTGKGGSKAGLYIGVFVFVAAIAGAAAYFLLGG